MNLAYQGLALGLRFSALAGRFLLVVIAARILQAEEFGFFSLYLVVLQLAPALASMDFYAETTRLILKNSSDEDSIIYRHFSLLFFSSVIVGPIAALAFWFSSDFGKILLFSLIPFFIVFETVANDVGRLLPPLGRPLSASGLLFLRQASPTLLLIALTEGFDIRLDIFDLLIILLGSSLMGSLVGFLLLGRTQFSNFFRVLDFGWAKAVLAKSLVFFAATILFRLIFSMDRFLIELTTDLATVGIYSLYVSIGLGIVSILEAGVSAWRYPSLVKAFLNGEPKVGIALLRSYSFVNLLATLAVVIAAYFLVPIFISALLDGPLVDALKFFPLILIGVLIFCGSLPFHYLIYAKRHDKMLVAINAAAIAFSLLYFWIYSDGSNAAIFGLFTAICFAIGLGRLAGAGVIILGIRRTN